MLKPHDERLLANIDPNFLSKVKQRIMTDSLGPDRKFPRWKNAAVAVYRETGWKGYWRGFVPCFLRAFPANAVALVAFEGVMRALK
jgi:solute carrier family 25 carnitine/acylcarnitine transporter 20/29